EDRPVTTLEWTAMKDKYCARAIKEGRAPRSVAALKVAWKYCWSTNSQTISGEGERPDYFTRASKIHQNYLEEYNTGDLSDSGKAEPAEKNEANIDGGEGEGESEVEGEENNGDNSDVRGQATPTVSRLPKPKPKKVGP